MWVSEKCWFICEERGEHSSSAVDFKTFKHGISSRARGFCEKTINSGGNTNPVQLQEMLRKEGVSEEHIPSTGQLSNLKAAKKRDFSEDSKYRLRDYQDLRDHFVALMISSQADYDAKGLLLVYLSASTFL